WPFSSVLPDAHPVLANLIDRSLTWDQAMRWPDAAAMRDAICSTCLTIFGEARPELMGADDLTLNARKPIVVEDDTTDVTERRGGVPVVRIDDDATAAYLEDDRT